MAKSKIYRELTGALLNDPSPAVGRNPQPPYEQIIDGVYAPRPDLAPDSPFNSEDDFIIDFPRRGAVSVASGSGKSGTDGHMHHDDDA